MVFFNYALRKLNAKIVYYGPGLCGKTTNLQWIHDHFEGGQRGKMISLSTEGDRTIFFDLLPLDIGTIRGMQVTLQLYTVPGQVHYNSTRQLVLRGADGVVFVADSQRTMRASNIESLHNLEENLKLQGVDLTEFPHALQFNKRDLRDLLSVDDMDHDLNPNSAPFFEAVATEGVGVQETLEGIVKLVMRSLRERYEPVAAPGQRPGAPSLSPPVPQAPAAGPAAPTASPPPAVPPARPAEWSPPGSTPAADLPPPPDAWASPTPGPSDASAPPPFEIPADQDHVSTGVYSDEQRRRLGVAGENLTTASVDDPGAIPLDAFKDEPSSPDILNPYAVEAMPDEPTSVRDVGGTGRDPVIIGAPDVDPWAVAPKPADPSRPFADQDTATSIATPVEDEADSGIGDVPEFAFGGIDDAASEPPGDVDQSPSDAPLSEAREDEPPAWDRGEPSADDEPDAAAEDRSTQGPATVEPPASPPRRAAQPGSVVDDLVASILGAGGRRRRAPERPAARTAEPPPFAEPEGAPEPPPFAGQEPPAEASPSAEPQPVVEPEPVVEPGPEPFGEPGPSPPPAPRSAARSATPVTVGQGDPFQVEEPPVAPGGASAAVARVDKVGAGAPHGGIVQIGDNQLHLRLQGTGAIAESGQVRALDIEVPVPGSWVGNRRVTLQLRLTLSPAAEDEDGGSS